MESRLIEAVTSGDVASVQRLGEELQGAMVVDQSLMQDLVLEAVSIASVDLMVELVDLLSTKNMYCYEVSCRGMQQTPASTYPKVTCEVSSKRVARFLIFSVKNCDIEKFSSLIRSVGIAGGEDCIFHRII